MQRFDSKGWNILVENLTIYAGQPVNAVFMTPQPLAVRLDATLQDKVKNGH
ncbi:hypothetical protein [Vibrio campbellii]|uniref:hypothetical protein n=1 Tax=Vibrio campbellii TaxID=680 RepID=UPI00210E838A|nr:hypothetical protein [Vibrio campbellii]UTZ44602.1 hypothetical protein HB764_25420 [Vibrio campbellii]